MNIRRLQTNAGTPRPYGFAPNSSGFNLSLTCTHATQVTLLLYDSLDPKAKPIHTIPLDPIYNKTGQVWHIGIENPPNPCYYLYQIEPNSTPLLDPYSRQITCGVPWRGFGKANAYNPKCGTEPPPSFLWTDASFQKIPPKDLVIYEMHIRAFTSDNSSGVDSPGTFAAAIQKIPHLVNLGVNAVELLPIFEFNESEYQGRNPFTRKTLCNYWGYSPINFFTLIERYSTGLNYESAVKEFKELVNAFHKAGIEVYLDVVYNHTAERREEDLFSFRGIDPKVYYMHDRQGHFIDFSGCGNTLNINHPTVLTLIMNSLHYCVSELHIDGFRFDLAAALCRDEQGNVLPVPPLLAAISSDPLLANTKLIAEPWDISGLYQVGNFFPPASERWMEWNGRYRDTVRRFLKGLGRSKGEFATRLAGSQDLYGSRGPAHSINFITAHDGFCLHDLVSYNQKHNLDNGEQNRDGNNDNNSWNCGHEGETEDPEILELRVRQMCNLHLALMVSRGVPMLLMGDEYGHTRQGNNNPWCQDNEKNWFSWSHLEENSLFFSFYSQLLAFRKTHPLLTKNSFLADHEICWHGRTLNHPSWNNNDPMLAYTLYDNESERDLFIAFNANHLPVAIEIPTPGNHSQWKWIAYTGLPLEEILYPEALAPIDQFTRFSMSAHSALILERTSQS